MDLFSHQDLDNHEQVVFTEDKASGLKAIIAVHSTRLGPALGGCRFWTYASEAEALGDALRLSRGMTYKAALAGLALGGGKSVILADSETQKTPEMMHAMGRAVDYLTGRYIVAEDVGTSVDDMDEIATETAYVSGVSSGAGDPSPWTAQGVFLAMQAAAQHRWGTGLLGRAVSVTGLGNVGKRLCWLLHEAGARLLVSDINPAAVDLVVSKTDAEPTDFTNAHALDVDVFAPCALGGGLNEVTIPAIQADIVCGAANNQLATPQDGIRLAEKNILYAPDYLVNAGGLISVARPALNLADADAGSKLKEIPRTLERVFIQAASASLTTDQAADRLAEARLNGEEPDYRQSA